MFMEYFSRFKLCYGYSVSDEVIKADCLMQLDFMKGAISVWHILLWRSHNSHMNNVSDTIVTCPYAVHDHNPSCNDNHHDPLAEFCIHMMAWRLCMQLRMPHHMMPLE